MFYPIQKTTNSFLAQDDSGQYVAVTYTVIKFFGIPLFYKENNTMDNSEIAKYLKTQVNKVGFVQGEQKPKRKTKRNKNDSKNKEA